MASSSSDNTALAYMSLIFTAQNKDWLLRLMEASTPTLTASNETFNVTVISKN